MLSDTEKRERLQRALDCAGNTHTIEDVVDMVRRGRAQFWTNGDGSIVTEIHEFPRLRSVHYWLISGRLPDCLALEDDINAWAMEQGCTMATAIGRRGWGRVAAPTGWREFYPNFIKPLVGRG